MKVTLAVAQREFQEIKSMAIKPNNMRTLYVEILDYAGDNLFEVLLKKWASNNDYSLFFAAISGKVQAGKSSLENIPEVRKYARFTFI